MQGTFCASATYTHCSRWVQAALWSQLGVLGMYRKGLRSSLKASVNAQELNLYRPCGDPE